MKHNLTDGEETLIILCLIKHRYLTLAYLGDPKGRPELGRAADEVESLAHRVWRESGHDDVKTTDLWEILNVEDPDDPNPTISLGDFVTCPDGLTGIVTEVSHDSVTVQLVEGCRSFPISHCKPVDVD